MHLFISLILIIILGLVCWIIASLDINRQHFKRLAYQEAQKIISHAEAVTENITDSLKVDYNTLFYEEVCFLYCLEVIKIVDLSIDDKLCNVLRKVLFSFLKKIPCLQFKENKKSMIEVFNQKKLDYGKIINQFDCECNIAFYNSVFDYQSELLPDDKEKLKAALIVNLDCFKNFYNDVI